MISGGKKIYSQIWRRVYLTAKWFTLCTSIIGTLVEFVKVARTQKLNFTTVAMYISNYMYDAIRLIKWSAIGKSALTQTNLQALIVMDYHRIEKGLALREPRVGFGVDTVERLLKNLRVYIDLYGVDETIQIASHVLEVYYQFNHASGNSDSILQEKIRSVCMKSSDFSRGGIEQVSRQQIWLDAKRDLHSFFSSRHSVRHFASTKIDEKLILQALELAQYTPSVCNRQSVKVYMFCDLDIETVLTLQNGNAGFRNQVDKLLIVASDLATFVSLGERNQCWIDGGMYSMSLVYALHSLGLGTCCLNWCVEKEQDQILRTITGIPDSESIIMMIAVGYLPEIFSVAQSPRKQISEVLVNRQIINPSSL